MVSLRAFVCDRSRQSGQSGILSAGISERVFLRGDFSAAVPRGWNVRFGSCKAKAQVVGQAQWVLGQQWTAEQGITARRF